MFIISLMTQLEYLTSPLLESLAGSCHKDIVLPKVQALDVPLLREARRQAALAVGKTSLEVSDALHWVTAEGVVVDVSAISLALLPDAVMITASCEFVLGDKHVTLEHVPVTLAQTPALLAHLHCQPEPVQRLVCSWANKYKVASQTEIKSLFKKNLTAGSSSSMAITSSVVRQKLVEPLEKALTRHLRIGSMQCAPLPTHPCYRRPVREPPPLPNPVRALDTPRRI